MGDFNTDIAAGLDAIYSAGGVAATFTDRDSDQTEVVALVQYDLTVYGTTADVSALTAAVTVRKSELQYAPRRGEWYTIGGVTYSVDSIVEESELEHTALVA